MFDLWAIKMISGVLGYISHGDFILPYNFLTFLNKYIYIWSFQSGAFNLDGIMRLPGRLFNILTYSLFGYEIAAYFYLFTSLAIIAVSFIIFLKVFTKIKSILLLTILTLLFTLNPAFLGNLAKIGLVACAALVPLIFVLVKKYFQSKNVLYLLPLVLILNYSALHPYAVFMSALSIIIAIGYFIPKTKSSLIDNGILKHLALTVIVALGVNAYFLIPIVATGTVSKTALSQEISSQQVDYTTLVDIANTNGFANALTLSKDVFLDFNFYEGNTSFIIFTIGSLGILIIFIYLLSVRSPIQDQKTPLLLFILLGLFITTIFLSSGDTIASLFNRALAETPIGWIFRAPLKWQLYSAVFFYMAFAFLVASKKISSWKFLSALALCLLMQSTFITSDIYSKLLSPRSISTFTELDKIDLNLKRLLFVSGGKCIRYSQENPMIMTELNQVTLSQNVQYKALNSGVTNTIKLSDYDYVMSCQDSIKNDEVEKAGFSLVNTFDNGTFKLFRQSEPNDADRDLVAISSQLYGTDIKKNFDKKSRVVNDGMDKTDFTDDVTTDVKGWVSQPFLDFNNISFNDNSIIAHMELPNNIRSNKSKTFSSRITSSQPINVRSDKDNVYISHTNDDIADTTPVSYGIDKNASGVISLKDDNYDFSDLIKNGQFLNGPWTPKVEDCFNYDSNPMIRMDVSAGDPKISEKQLTLSTERHLACTSTKFELQEDRNLPSKLLLQYLVKSLDETDSVTVTFDSEDSFDQYSLRSLPPSSVQKLAGGWNKVSTVIDIPPNTKSGIIHLYNYANANVGKTSSHYANISAIEMPSYISEIYAISDQTSGTSESNQTLIDYNYINPTNHRFNLSTDNDFEYLHLRDTFNQHWSLRLNGHEVPQSMASHIMVNGYDNLWVLKISEICKEALYKCDRRSDGTYFMHGDIIFSPQRYFEYGLVVSSCTLLITLSYFARRVYLQKYKRKNIAR